MILVFGLDKNSLRKLILISFWFFFYLNILFGYFSYLDICCFSSDFFLITFYWVSSIYFFWINNYCFFLSLIEESNFFIIFFIFLIELLRKVIQFFTIIIRLIVNVFFGECFKFLLVYNNSFFYIFLGGLEFFILLIQSIIFYYMFLYYCNE